MSSRPSWKQCHFPALSSSHPDTGGVGEEHRKGVEVSRRVYNDPITLLSNLGLVEVGCMDGGL